MTISSQVDLVDRSYADHADDERVDAVSADFVRGKLRPLLQQNETQMRKKVRDHHDVHYDAQIAVLLPHHEKLFGLRRVWPTGLWSPF